MVEEHCEGNYLTACRELGILKDIIHLDVLGIRHLFRRLVLRNRYLIAENYSGFRALLLEFITEKEAVCYVFARAAVPYCRGDVRG